MKIVNKNVFLIMLTGIILSSCASVEFVKRKYMPGYYVNKSSKNEILDNEKEIFSDDVLAMIDVKSIEQQASTDAQICGERSRTIGRLYSKINASIQKNKPWYRPDIYFEECDEIILMNGDIVKVKVTEIGVLEIKYRDCDNLNRPEISILKSDVFMIKYANGTKDVFYTEKSKPNNLNTIYTGNATTDGYAIVSLVTGIVGILSTITIIGGFIFGILGIIFGVVSKRRIKENPDKYKDNRLADAGMVTGTIAMMLSLIIVVLLISSLGSLF